MTDTSLKKLSKEDLLKNQQLITKGKEAEKIICNYVDLLTSTENACNPDDGNWVKPNIHPCKKKIEEIEKLKWDKLEIMKILSIQFTELLLLQI